MLTIKIRAGIMKRATLIILLISASVLGLILPPAYAQSGGAASEGKEKSAEERTTENNSKEGSGETKTFEGKLNTGTTTCKTTRTMKSDNSGSNVKVTDNSDGTKTVEIPTAQRPSTDIETRSNKSDSGNDVKVSRGPDDRTINESAKGSTIELKRPQKEGSDRDPSFARSSSISRRRHNESERIPQIEFTEPPIAYGRPIDFLGPAPTGYEWQPIGWLQEVVTRKLPEGGSSITVTETRAVIEQWGLVPIGYQEARMLREYEHLDITRIAGAAQAYSAVDRVRATYVSENSQLLNNEWYGKPFKWVYNILAATFGFASVKALGTVYTSWRNKPLENPKYDRLELFRPPPKGKVEDLDKYRHGYKVRKENKKSKKHNCTNDAQPPPCPAPERPPATRK